MAQAAICCIISGTYSMYSVSNQYLKKLWYQEFEFEFFFLNFKQKHFTIFLKLNFYKLNF
jgi:hypothetical protein